MRRLPEPPSSEPDSTRVLAALSRVLKSDKFVSAPQMSAFLRYVVEQSVNGDKKRIKAYTVAVDALGKPDTFDPQNDPVVRVLAGRLRASLAAYYEVHPDSDVHIQMKPGSYVPRFVDVTLLPAPTDSASVDRDSLDTVRVGDTADAPACKPQDNLTASPIPLTDPARLGGMCSEPSQTSSDARQQSHQAAGKAALLSVASPLSGFPVAGFVLLALAISIVVLLNNRMQTRQDSDLISAEALHDQDTRATGVRQRPEQVTVFVDARSESDTLSEQLNTILSGVFLESSDIRVYRILEGLETMRYWPEDYLVSLDVLPLPAETRISVQLVDAQTGQIRHSDSITLGKKADETLTRSELASVIEFARHLVSDEGPLLLDYQQKQLTLQTSDK